MAKLSQLKIVIAVNKHDLWFCRICVASIRYYYPHIEILLIKDYLNGRFSTIEIEEFWNVQILKTNINKFGWGASKNFFLLDAPANEKYLILDSDTVFVSPFLQIIHDSYLFQNDFVVSADIAEDPDPDWMAKTYFDIENIKRFDPSFQYQGYLFNTGQLFITGGKISDEDLQLFFSRAYPYWNRKDLFPLVDQSVYNYVFPKMESLGKIKVGKAKFMIWSESAEAKGIELESVINKSLDCGLIHWAGSLRVPILSKMTRGDLLKYFENYYYQNIPFSLIKSLVRRVAYFYNLYSRRFQQKIRFIV